MVSCVANLVVVGNSGDSRFVWKPFFPIAVGCCVVLTSVNKEVPSSFLLLYAILNSIVLSSFLELKCY